MKNKFEILAMVATVIGSSSAMAAGPESVCRYFVSTDNFSGLSYDSDYDNLTVLMVDENKYTGIIAGTWNDIFDGKETSVLASGKNPIAGQSPQTPIDVTSDWKELQNNSGEKPEMRLYAFNDLLLSVRGYTWHTKLKHKNAEDLSSIPYQTCEVIKKNPAVVQSCAARKLSNVDYELKYHVLKLCSTDRTKLFDPALFDKARIQKK